MSSDIHIEQQEQVFPLPSGNAARFGVSHNQDGSVWAVAFSFDGRYLCPEDLAFMLSNIMPQVLPRLIGQPTASAGFYY